MVGLLKKDGRTTLIWVLVLTMSLASMAVILFPDSIQSQIRHYVGERLITLGWSPDNPVEYGEVLERLVSSVFSAGPAVPTLRFHIKFKHLQKLGEKRSEAIERRLLIQESDDFVPATVEIDDRLVPVKIRLKGDWVDHLRGDKWSFRVHVRNDDHILAMRRFSIQHPGTRAYQGERLFLSVLRGEGVLVPRYFFVRVAVNGSDIGIMALEEHFSDEIMERNGRRESVIIAFDETDIWTNRLGGNPDPLVQNASIKSFRFKRVLKSPRLVRNYEAAVGLLRGVMRGTIPTSAAFDVEKLGRFVAAAKLFGAEHGLTWANLRFYFDPVSARLEPIGFDSNFQLREVDRHLDVEKHLPWFLLNDPPVYRAFSRSLERMARSVIEGPLVAELKAKEVPDITILGQEFLLLGPMQFDRLVSRAKDVLELVDGGTGSHRESPAPPTMNRYSKLLHAYLIDQDGRPALLLENRTNRSIEVFGISVDANVSTETYLNGDAGPKLGSVIVLPANVAGRPPETRIIYLKQFRQGAAAEIMVTARIAPDGEPRQHRAVVYASALAESPVPSSTVEVQLSTHSFLAEDPSARILTVAAGTWQVSDDIVVPNGYSLHIVGPTRLRFFSGAAIVSHGPLRFLGQEDAPVLLEAVGGPERPWDGVVVLDAGGLSVWRNVVVRHTKSLGRRHWALTGGVTFYRSPVQIHSSAFTGHDGEDALNIVSSAFEVIDTDFSNTASDALDVDFSDGLVTGSRFSDIGRLGGGDAVDIAGSSVTVESTSIDGVSDKGLSVGEGSSMKARNLTIAHTLVAAATKDASDLTIVDSRVVAARVAGLMAYRKKLEYGPAALTAEAIEFVDTANEAIVQSGSSLLLEGAPIPTENLDVDTLYRTVMRKNPG